MGNKRGVFFGLAVVTLGLFLFGLLFTGQAAATSGINQEMSFEGKLVDGSGVNIPDGSYNMEFKIYTAAGSCNPTTGSGCTLGWTEDWLVSGGHAVTLTSGTFAVNLDDVAANNFSGIDFNSYPLYISIQVGSTSSCTPAGNFQANCGGDGEMKPYIKLTSSPYALNAGELGGVAASGFGQLTTANVWSNTNTFHPTTNVSSALVQQTSAVSPTADIFDVQGTNGTTNFLQVTSTAANQATVTLNSTGALTLTGAANSTWDLGAGNTLSLQTASNGAITTGTGLLTAGGALTATGLLTANGGVTVNTSTASDVTITSGTNVPTADQVSITNAGSSGVTIAGVNGISVNYKGGAAAVEAAGMRIDFAPGTTSGGTWSGMRIVANATGAVSGVTEYGIKLEGPSSSGGGTAEAMYVGSGWDIGLDLQSGGIQLAGQTDPASPAANNLRIYAKNIAGRMLPKWIGPSGVDTPFQAGLGFNRIAYSEPNGTANCGTGATGFGSTSTGAGTCTSPVPASTNLKSSTRRLDFSSGTTAGTVAYQKQNVLQVWRGNAAGEGGFFYTARFGLNTLQSGNRAFIGLADSITAPTNVDPTTNTTPGRLGMAINANTGNWNWINNITGTAPTVTNLGATFPINTTDLFELIIFCQEDGSTITYRVTDISTGAQVTGSTSTNIPGSTTFLAPMNWITNNATAAAAIMDFGGWYLESDN